jgi:co-chaperonin GroES (HSP10)
MIKVEDIKPCDDYILVKIDPDEEQKRGLIIVPTTVAANRKTDTGTIIAVGPGRRDPNNLSERIPVDCEPGDRILFATFIGYPIWQVGEDGYFMIKYNDKMAFLERESCELCGCSLGTFGYCDVCDDVAELNE